MRSKGARTAMKATAVSNGSSTKTWRGARPSRPDARRSPPGLPPDGAVAPDRRQGNPAQEPEPDLLPDQRCRARSGARRGRHDAQGRIRLVLSLLPRPRALPRPRRHAVRDVPERRRREGRSRVPAGGRCRRTGATRSTTSSPARAPPARSACTRSARAEAGVLYDKITSIEGAREPFHRDEVVYVSIGEGATSEGEFWESLNAACLGRLPRRLSSSRTTDTRFRSRSRCRPPEATSPGWSRRSRACWCRASTGPTSSKATAR